MPEAVYTEDSYVSDSPYSQAVIHNDTVYVAGQVPKNTGGDIVGETIQPQTEQVMDNIETILDAAGTSMKNIMKATVFLTDISDFDAFNEVYARRIPEPRPARSAVEVSDLAVDVRVEIEVIAAI